MSRSLYGAFLVAAGIVIGIAASILVAILVWGGWPPALYGQIVGILGKARHSVRGAFVSPSSSARHSRNDSFSSASAGR